jgi:inosose dehydratase
MIITQPLTRRSALKTAALGALALPLLGSRLTAALVTPATSATPALVPSAKEKLRLGLASVTTRLLTLDEVIAVAGVLRVTNLALFKTHCAWETATPATCRAIGEKVRAAGLTLAGSGVINLPNDETKLRAAFENAKAAGLATMVCKPEPVALPIIEKFVKEYDQRLAIHNHGPEDKTYPSPLVAWKTIQPFDARIGLCLDVGHCARAGMDPAAAIRQFSARLYDVHMKDTVAIVGATKDMPVEIGSGRLDIAAMLRALLAINYTGVVSFEYEKPTGNPVTGVAESIGYLRGVLATLT